MENSDRIAILIPCYNEAATIGKVVDDFRAQLPEATIYVFDNCCTDETADVAMSHGATVVKEPRRGKGFVVESMFDRIDAEYFVMADGDDTYPPEKVHDLLAPVLDGDADMAVGARLGEYSDKSFRRLHIAGNSLVRWLINRIFHTNLTDILSGYRAYNRRVVSRVPIVSSGFEVETELTAQMLYYRLKIVEVAVPYRPRPAGSRSKLNTFRDGFRVLWKLFSLFRSFKPLTFFGSFGIILLVLGIAAGIPALCDFITLGYVYHVPLAILATGLILLSVGSVFMGLLLHALNWRLKELHNIIVRRKEMM